MSNDPRIPRESEPVEELLRAAAAHDREVASGRDAAFLRRMERRLREEPAPPVAKAPPRWNVLLPAGALAAAVLVVAVFVFLPGRRGPADGLLHGEGGVQLLAVNGGERVVSDEEGRFIYLLGGGAVSLFGGGGSDLLVIGPGRIQLDRGEIWVHVVGGAQGFAVETPGGTIAVVGTLFSVAVADQTIVRVTRGAVEARVEGSTTVLGAGQSATFGGDAVGIQEGPAAGEPPRWVWELADRAAAFDWRETYPSGSPHQ